MPTLIRPAAALSAAIVLLAACDSPTEPPALDSFVIVIDGAPIAEAEPFRLSVTAVSTRGESPWLDYSGPVQVRSDVGTLSPGTLTLERGEGAGDFVLMDASGDVTIHVSANGTESTLGVHAEGSAIAAEPDGPVEAYRPPEEYEVDFDAFAPHPQAGGHPVSTNTVVLMFEVGTTVRAANAILRPHEGVIVGGNAGVVGRLPAALIVRFPTETHEALADITNALEADASVRVVVPDLAAMSEMKQPRGPSSPVTTISGDAWEWTRTPRGGNWGMEMIRAPQLWNLGVRTLSDVPVGVLDVGFADHEDIEFAAKMDWGNVVSPYARNHGLHVAGTIGATFDNGVGVDGLAPNASLFAAGMYYVGVRPCPSDSEECGYQTTAQAIQTQFMRFVSRYPQLKVVNMSLGLWGSKQTPEKHEWAAELVRRQGEVFAVQVALLYETTGATPLVVTSAGNREGREVQLSSPWNAAMLDSNVIGTPIRILPIESTTSGDTRATHSNRGGFLGAPGSRILSAGYARLAPIDTTGNSWSADHEYTNRSGTSMAAPHVSGLAAYLMGIADLTPVEVAQVMHMTARPIANGADRIDAFDAALAIDQIRPGLPVRTRLMDVNSSGAFDERDIERILEAFDDPHRGDSIYSRFDLNGNSHTLGGEGQPFDLNASGSHGTPTQTIAGTDVSFNEDSVSDKDILCYYAYDPDVFSGNASRRDELLDERCTPTAAGMYSMQTTYTATDRERGDTASCSATWELEVTQDAEDRGKYHFQGHGASQTCTTALFRGVIFHPTETSWTATIGSDGTMQFHGETTIDRGYLRDGIIRVETDYREVGTHDVTDYVHEGEWDRPLMNAEIHVERMAPALRSRSELEAVNRDDP